MIDIEAHFSAISAKKDKANVVVRTLGNFEVWRNGVAVSSKEWGRDATIQLFQFFITNRHRHGLHKEQIIDRIWGELDLKAGSQNFKVAHHGVNKVLDPNRESRGQSKYIVRQGASYQLIFDNIWLDVNAIDQYIALGNQYLNEYPEITKNAFNEAINLYKGMYLPNRLYEDWSSEERERIQLLVLGAFMSLSELLVDENPMESIRLTQLALQIDHTWEDAYRIQMGAYLNTGNRPMAIKTYQQCEKVLNEEFGIDPLPETKQLFKRIKGIK